MLEFEVVVCEKMGRRNSREGGKEERNFWYNVIGANNKLVVTVWGLTGKE